MKNIITTSCVALLLLSCQIKAQETTKTPETAKAVEATIEGENIATERASDMIKPNLYDYNVKDIDGNNFSFEKLRGKKILIVNTASKCGNTPQYAELEMLYQKHKSNNFVIIGFPSNDFGKQEPGTNTEIKEFCTKNYGVTFPMMGKVSVTGPTMCELYKFLTQKSKNGVQDSQVDWNFQKYLINEFGELVKVFPSKVTPLNPELESLIKQ